MSTYAISDIHGAYDEFHNLLNRIRFHYDGSDSLYLLGDFGDWGGKSMETILFVKRLDEQYPFVHCLMGNHEQMFLAAMEGGIRGDEANDAAVNWLTANRGLHTWNAYVSLPPQQQEELHQWLRNLPLSYDVKVGGRLIMLAHAYPYYYDMEYSEEEAARRRMDAVWRRLLLYEDPFASYTGPKHYDLLICGHTITDFYEREAALGQTRSPLDSVVSTVTDAVPSARNRIFHGDRFLDIDCGAKCMAIAMEEDDGFLQSVKRSVLERSQLAGYCLETGEEFYVSRPQTVVGVARDGAAAPDLRVPQVGTRPFDGPLLENPPEVAGMVRRKAEAAVRRDRVDYPERAPRETAYPDPGLAGAREMAEPGGRQVQKFLKNIVTKRAGG